MTENVDRPVVGPAIGLPGEEAVSVDLLPRLAAFARVVLGQLWEGYGLDGEDIQSLALKHKLIRRVAFDPTKHTDHWGVGVYPGDEWYVEDPAIRRAARRVALSVEPRSGIAASGAQPSPGHSSKSGEPS